RSSNSLRLRRRTMPSDHRAIAPPAPGDQPNLVSRLRMSTCTHLMWALVRCGISSAVALSRFRAAGGNFAAVPSAAPLAIGSESHEPWMDEVLEVRRDRRGDRVDPDGGARCDWHIYERDDDACGNGHELVGGCRVARCARTEHRRWPEHSFRRPRL